MGITACLPPTYQPVDDPQQQRRPECVDLGENGVIPERRTERQHQRPQRGHQPARSQRPAKQRRKCHGNASHHGRQQIRAIRDGPDRQVGQGVRQQRVQGIAGRVRRAERGAHILELGGIFGAPHVRHQRAQIDGERDQADRHRKKGVGADHRPGRSCRWSGWSGHFKSRVDHRTPKGRDHQGNHSSHRGATC